MKKDISLYRRLGDIHRLSLRIMKENILIPGGQNENFIV
jgi:hypothetical protein